MIKSQPNVGWSNKILYKENNNFYICFQFTESCILFNNVNTDFVNCYVLSECDYFATKTILVLHIQKCQNIFEKQIIFITPEQNLQIFQNVWGNLWFMGPIYCPC